jgi:hypothetical protein
VDSFQQMVKLNVSYLYFTLRSMERNVVAKKGSIQKKDR